MPHSNENDDTRIVPAIGESMADASTSANSESSGPDQTPTIIRGDDDVPSSDHSIAAQPTKQAGLEGTRYEVVQSIGEGGMGTVYLANQLHPIKRRVAIKVVRKGPDLARFKKRFVNERQALARLDHPHIAKFLDSGQTIGGRPYYVMEFVPGTPITQFCDYYQLDLRQRISLFTQVCEAVSHAHTKAIIHRDLKPSNVLAYMDNEKPVVKVIDFGLAKVAQLDDESLHQTRMGAVIGSSYYMSPEQATASSDVDTRSDVYSLGVILYELLTGVRPFDISMFPQASELEFLRHMSTTSAPAPSNRLRALPETDRDRIAQRRQLSGPQLMKVLAQELEWIPLKALRLEPERRYDGPNELADDIRRYLASEALHAGPEALGYRLSKFLRKNRKWVAASSALALLLLVTVTVVSILFLMKAKEQAKLDEALQASLKNQSLIEDQLSRELSARLAVEMKERLNNPALASTLPAAVRAAREIRPTIAPAGSDFAPHDVWRVTDPPATIRSLWDLVSWSASRARGRFSQISIPPRANWLAPELRRDGLPLDGALNVLPFAESRVTDGRSQVVRLTHYVFCNSKEEFSALTANTRSMLKRSGFEQAGESTVTRQVFSTGSVEIAFQYPLGGTDAKWAAISVSYSMVDP